MISSGQKWGPAPPPSSKISWSFDLAWNPPPPPPLSLSLSLCIYIKLCNGVVWSVEGQDTGSGVSKMETTAGVRQQSGFICSAADNFQHTQNPHSHAQIYKRTARAARNTRYRYSKIGPLDHKMADNCVFLARTNTLSSTISKPIKTWKTANKSYSYNLLNRTNKMYTHDLFYL